MSTFLDIPGEDKEKIDPKAVATSLKSSFESYYLAEKVKIERRKKDLKALKLRAGIKDDIVPAIASNIAAVLYDTVQGRSTT